MSEPTEAVLEAAEQVQEVLDNVEDAIEVFRTNPLLILAAGLVGVVAGGVGGYFFAKKRLEAHYEELANSEIAEAREFYQGLAKVNEQGKTLSPMEVLERNHPEAAATLREYRGEKAVSDILEEEASLTVVTNDEESAVIAESYVRTAQDDEDDARLLAKAEKTANTFIDPRFDLAEEKKHRTPDKPYIITHDEFFEANDNYDQVSYGYYTEDDVVVDENQMPLDNMDRTVGEDHLVMFGHGSGDRNIVYIRNERLGMDIELTKIEGSYVDSVLDLGDQTNTLRHSDQRDRRRAFRQGEG